MRATVVLRIQLAKRLVAFQDGCPYEVLTTAHGTWGKGASSGGWRRTGADNCCPLTSIRPNQVAADASGTGA
jgi:hypothetical protein